MLFCRRSYRHFASVSHWVGPGRTTGKKSRNYREAQEEGQIFFWRERTLEGGDRPREHSGTLMEQSQKNQKWSYFRARAFLYRATFRSFCEVINKQKKVFFPAVTSNDAVIVTFFPGQTTRTSDQ